ncbi:MAG: CDP-alcohol phosphatidyltransferase family protein, partial [Bacteroidaceae bacterium]|nr:CDP-alcohol phosphatidyltransferase family protein [Bacteroidaceae bacterium]
AIAVRETFRPIPFAPEHEWGVIIWILCSFAGFWIHGSQCQLADYYRNIHLYFIKEENGNEFDNSDAQRIRYKETPWKGNFFWKIFLNAYIGYTANQERMSPAFQTFIQKVNNKFGSKIPTGLRNAFRKGSLPLMKYTNILTFNSRALFLWFAMLTGHLWLYLFFEIVILGALFIYMRHRHEALCRRLTKEIENDNEFN